MDTTVKLTPRIATVLGALIADSAALGLHWLYDPERIAQIEKKQNIAFLTPDPGNYADTKGFFAHGGKTAGDSSGYGEICLLMLKHYAAHGEFDRMAYQTEFRNLFGPGGAYRGYVDSPTRQTLLKLIPLRLISGRRMRTIRAILDGRHWDLCSRDRFVAMIELLGVGSGRRHTPRG